MNSAWQLPISGATVSRRTKRAHWFKRSKRTNALVAAACGLKVNPGFAKAAPATKRCLYCRRGLA